MHKFVLNFKGHHRYIDHRNHNRLDNRKFNLHICSQKINGINRRKINKNNTSGYRNVSFDGKGNPIVQLQDESGRNQVWRDFKDVHEAGAFAEKMRQEIYDKRINNLNH
jgi:uncharacterized membrane protein